MRQKFKESCLSKTHGKAEIITLLVYVIGLCVIGFFHEPWFDEAQAWQIARCASFKEILFTVPHYEGHPPLWHLILSPFAKSGAPFELSLKAVNIAFCTIAVALLLFRSPFPKLIRCIIPFTYFIFYQFGIVCRPYCLMMVAFFLAAITYGKRNEKPVCYILSLSLLCLVSAYGILFAGGLCMVWTGEIIREYQKSKKWKNVFQDKRPYALLGILILALFLGLHMLPAEDCYYPGYDLPLKEMLTGGWYFIFVVPFDALFGCYIDIDGSAEDTTFGLLFDCLGGAAVMLVLILLTYKNRKFLTFIIPYTLYMGFCIVKYISVHHIGGFTLFTLFILWIMLEECGTLTMPDMFCAIYQKIESVRLKKILPVFGIGLCCMPIIYSTVSSVTDICRAYGPKQIVNLIRSNHLENNKWMVIWTYNFKNENTLFNATEMPTEYPEIEKHYVNESGLAVTTLPYFDRNMFINFNIDEQEHLYVTHRLYTDPDTEFRKWEQEGVPDFIIGYVPLDLIYDEQTLSNVKYLPIKEYKHGNIWKLSQLQLTTTIYIREDLLDEYPQFEIQKY